MVVSLEQASVSQSCARLGFGSHQCPLLHRLEGPGNLSEWRYRQNFRDEVQIPIRTILAAGPNLDSARSSRTFSSSTREEPYVWHSAIGGRGVWVRAWARGDGSFGRHPRPWSRRSENLPRPSPTSRRCTKGKEGCTSTATGIRRPEPIRTATGTISIPGRASGRSGAGSLTAPHVRK